VLSARTRAALGVDTRRHLASCAAPVLYVAGSRDRVVPRHNIDDVRSAARRCEVVTIDGPHLALFTNAAPAALHIADFVRRTARPEAGAEDAALARRSRSQHARRSDAQPR
jgi:pimeloyl-ACP methyl ester carboxylesterase